jgi:hypothetical protein
VHWVGRDAKLLAASSPVSDPVAAIKGLAQALLLETDFVAPPVNLKVLGSFRGIDEIRRVEMLGSARLRPDGTRLVIDVNTEHPIGRRNFSICHEISHTLMPTYAGEAVEDLETGNYSASSELEFLCDIGASELLLSTPAVRRIARELAPTISAVVRIADDFGASLHATARKLAEIDVWSCGFVFWEPGLTKVESYSVNQALLPMFDDQARPAAKMRAMSAYTSNSFRLYFPRSKSADWTSSIGICDETRPHTYGVELFGLGSRTVRLRCENIFAPYRIGDTVRPRVFSLLLREDARIAESIGPVNYRLDLS